MNPTTNVLTWRKSSYSTANSEMCLEVTQLLTDTVAIRDSKNPEGALLTFTSRQWATFIKRIKRGQIR